MKSARFYGSLPDYAKGSKWQHFAFEADADRMLELEAAIEAWMSLLDVTKLHAFVVDHELPLDEDPAVMTTAVTPARAAAVVARVREVTALPCDTRVPEDVLSYLLAPLTSNKNVTKSGRLRVERFGWKSLTNSVVFNDGLRRVDNGTLCMLVWNLRDLRAGEMFDASMEQRIDDLTEVLLPRSPDARVAPDSEEPPRWDAEETGALYSGALARCAVDPRGFGLRQHYARLSELHPSAGFLMPRWIPNQKIPVHHEWLERFGDRPLGSNGETSVAWAAGDVLGDAVESLSAMLHDASAIPMRDQARVAKYRDACEAVAQRGGAVLTVEGEALWF